MPPAKPIEAHPREYSFFAGFLSYLVPGLGQIYQGRVLKGLLFMVCLLGLFFYGMRLGSYSNVYLPNTGSNDKGYLKHMPSGLVWLSSIVNDRLPFAGQFFIGVAAWPAILQYNMVDAKETVWNRWVVKPEQSEFWGNFQKTPPETHNEAVAQVWRGKSLNELQSDGDKSWDLGWVYTVIAGVLNILVIYDAIAGPAFLAEEGTNPKPREEAVPA